MKSIEGVDVKGKRVILRCDLNVSFKGRNVKDDYRIVRSLKTIEDLLNRGARIIILSHISGSTLSGELAPVARDLEKKLGKEVKFVDRFLNKGKAVADSLKEGELCLFDNVRIYPEEEKNDIEFAKKLAEMGDIYVNDAFSVCHRNHASVQAITTLLPTYHGYLLKEEVDTIAFILKNVKRPFISIIGGKKLKTKVSVIERLTKLSDHVLIGGNIANVILQAQGLTISGEMPEPDVLDLASRINITNPKIHLPVDASCGLIKNTKDYCKPCAVGTAKKEERIYDIGKETVELYRSIILTAKTIFINGPVGLIEDERFSHGTRGVFEAIRDSSAFCVAGGGETATFLKENNLLDSVDFLSTGGGAMLAFIEGKKLPGLEVLGYYD